MCHNPEVLRMNATFGGTTPAPGVHFAMKVDNFVWFLNQNSLMSFIYMR